MDVASETGMTPVSVDPKGDVGGLIAAVESKMSELMAWHAQQVKQLENDKSVLQETIDKQNETILGEKKTLAERLEQVDQQRIKLVELTSKLRAEESAMSREWAAVQQEREAVQRQSNELNELRKRTEERAKAWLETTATELSQPLKLAETEPTHTESPQTPPQDQGDHGEHDHEGEHHHDHHDGEHHHAA